MKKNMGSIIDEVLAQAYEARRLLYAGDTEEVEEILEGLKYYFEQLYQDPTKEDPEIKDSSS